MLAKFIIYGFLGWVVEVVFTGVASAVFRKDRSATATTYLWMHPIYGGAMLVLERFNDWLGFMLVPLLLKAVIDVAFIYAVEFTTGWLLKVALGKCPWDYGTDGWSVKGFIRLDYAPTWFLAALLFEPVRVGVSLAIQSVSLGKVLATAVGVGG